MSPKVPNSSFIHHIRGGRIIDPKNGIDRVSDLWLVDGLIHKIVDGFPGTPDPEMSPPISNPNCLRTIEYAPTTCLLYTSPSPRD